MAIDNTPPRLKLIATIAAITVVTLVSLDFVFKSYYAMMTDEATREKLAPTTDVTKQHEAENSALTHASIDQAMAQFAKGARPEVITPNPSDDLAPMTGWSKLPKPAPMRVGPATGGIEHGDHAVLVAADGGAPLATGDGGALGAPHADAGSAGALHAAADAGGAPRGIPKDAGAAAPRAPQH